VSPGPQRARIVTCPTCKGESLYAPQNPARPFCSQRCKNNDFGAWASEAFRVAPRNAPGDPDEPEEITPPPSDPR
jgi:uncharacterized protein